MRRREHNDLALSGWKAFLHRLVMFLLFPLRKPLIFFPVVLVLFLAPTFRGVKPAEVHLWYWNKIKAYTNSAVTFVQNETKKVIPENLNIKIPLVGEEKTEPKGTDKLVDYPVADVNANRKAIFERASGGMRQAIDIENNDVQNEVQQQEQELLAAERLAQLAVQVLAQAEPEKSVEEVPVKAEPVEPKKEETPVVVPKKLPLVYLDEPKEVIGTVNVYNANELEVDGTYIFLYGIYVNPDTEEGVEAKQFLEKLLKNQIVRCSIVAYTFQDVATGMCYVGGENINKLLVDKNLSKNVAL